MALRCRGAAVVHTIKVTSKKEERMWTPENRERHDRSGLRYPSDLSDEEWRLVEPLIPPARRGGRHRSVDLRAVLNGVLYVLETGCQWRHLPGLAAA
ncbi:transposase [Azospirillum argentinense]